MFEFANEGTQTDFVYFKVSVKSGRGPNLDLLDESRTRTRSKKMLNPEPDTDSIDTILTRTSTQTFIKSGLGHFC